VACHAGNGEAVAWGAPAYQPDCTGACHMYEDSSFTTIKKTRLGEHRARDGDW
jgi:hypothetical protein